MGCDRNGDDGHPRRGPKWSVMRNLRMCGPPNIIFAKTPMNRWAKCAVDRTSLNSANTHATHADSVTTPNPLKDSGSDSVHSRSPAKNTAVPFCSTTPPCTSFKMSELNRVSSRFTSSDRRRSFLSVIGDSRRASTMRPRK